MPRSKLSELRKNVFELLTSLAEEGWFDSTEVGEHQLFGFVLRVTKLHKVHSTEVITHMCREWLHGGPGVVERCGL